MRPDIDSPARRLTRQECYLHEWMAEAMERGDFDAAKRLREQLRPLSERRSAAAQLEARR